MSESLPRKAPVWMAGISVTIVVFMAIVWFAQVRLIAEQNHDLMIDNQNLEIQVETLKAALSNEGDRVIARLDAGLPLEFQRQPRSLNVAEDLKGPIIGALLRQIEDDRPYVQHNGLRYLAAIQPSGDRQSIFVPMVVPAVIPKLRDERLHDAAISVLNQYRPYAANAAPVILETSDCESLIGIVHDIRHARGFDPQCDYIPLLVRFIQHNEDQWQLGLDQLQSGFIDADIQQAYQGALEKASDEKLRRRYAGILRFLKDRSSASSLTDPLRSVESYVESDER